MSKYNPQYTLQMRVRQIHEVRATPFITIRLVATQTLHQAQSIRGNLERCDMNSHALDASTASSAAHTTSINTIITDDDTYLSSYRDAAQPALAPSHQRPTRLQPCHATAGLGCILHGRMHTPLLTHPARALRNINAAPALMNTNHNMQISLAYSGSLVGARDCAASRRGQPSRGSSWARHGYLYLRLLGLDTHFFRPDGVPSISAYCLHAVVAYCLFPTCSTVGKGLRTATKAHHCATSGGNKPPRSSAPRQVSIC